MRDRAGDIDAVMGGVLRHTRLTVGLSLKALADQSGVSYQQLQKYESGANRVSVSRLFLLCHAMGVSPTDLIGRVQAQADLDRQAIDPEDLHRLKFSESLAGRRAIEALAAIDDVAVLRAVLDFLATVGHVGEQRE